MPEYSRASRDDLAAVVELIAGLNVKGDHRIGYLGDRLEEIARELTEYGAIDNASGLGNGLGFETYKDVRKLRFGRSSKS